MVDGFAYVKIDGMLAGLAGLPSGKYVKTAVPQESGKPVTNPSEIAQGVEDIKAQLDKLPTPPTKLPDEKCGDVDCYHVQVVVSAADLAKLSPEAAAQAKGDYTLDVWSRKSDLRPAKIERLDQDRGDGHDRRDVDLQVRRHGRRERAAGRPGHGDARRVAVPVATTSHPLTSPERPLRARRFRPADEAACRPPTYNDPVSPASRRKPSGTRPDDAPEAVGTAFLDVPEDRRSRSRRAGLAARRPAARATSRRSSRRTSAASSRRSSRRAASANAQRRAEEIVKRLNPEQARAVTTTEGPLLILAGAGSGKTRVLAHRIAYLIGVKNARPWSILAVTFTNRAAGELRERIISLVGEPGRDVQAGTFHSLCARVLRRHGEAIGISRRFVVYDTDDQQALMKQILREEDLPLTGEFRPSAVLGAISRAKNEMLDATFLRDNAVNHHERTIARLATPLRGAPQAVRRARLRRPPPRGRPAVRRVAHDARVVPGSVALPPRRRVPGHEPAAVPVGPGARREAPQPRGRRRRRPVDLPLARRRHPEHPRLRARLPRRDGRQARAQLPLDAADPRRRPRGRLPQLGADRQEALDRPRRRPPDPALRGLQRGGGGGVDRPPDRGPDRRPRLGPHPAGRRRRRRGRSALPAARHRRDVPDERPVPLDRGGVPALRDPLPARRRRPVLQPARGQGRAGVPPGPAVRHGLGQLRADHQRPGPGDRRQDDRGPPPRPAHRRPHDVGGDRAGGPGRGREPPAADAGRAGRVRRARSPGSGRGSGCCRCPSCSTRSSRRRATGRCSRTAPRTARSAGRTCSSCAR